MASNSYWVFDSVSAEKVKECVQTMRCIGIMKTQTCIKRTYIELKELHEESSFLAQCKLARNTKERRTMKTSRS